VEEGQGVREDEAVWWKEVPVGGGEEEVLYVDAEDEGEEDALLVWRVSFATLVLVSLFTV
jgi:hypothetical protein